MRKYGKKDRNQPEIEKYLRAIGASVQDLSMVGGGCVDLLVGFRGKNYVFEIKDGELPASKRTLTADEARWHSLWRGQAYVVISSAQAINILMKDNA